MRKITKKLKNHFVPHSGNDHEPHFLRHKSLSLILAILIIIELAFLAEVFFVFKKDSFLATVLPGVLTNLTNQARIENGVNPLTENELLKKAAEMKANDMAKKSYFAHTSPEGITPWYWLIKANYKYSYAGENLAVNFFESEDVAKAWMASPTHRANIVRKEFTEVGIATASGIYKGHNAVFVVQFFGKPINVKPTPILTESESINPTKLAVGETQTNVLGEEIVNEEIITDSKDQVAQILPQEEIIKEVEELELLTTEIEPTQNITPKENNVYYLLSSPRKTTSYVLYTILAIVFMAFAIFLWKAEKKHPEVILRSMAMMFVVLALLVLNLKTLHIDTVLPDNSEPNSIAS